MDETTFRRYLPFAIFLVLAAFLFLSNPFYGMNAWVEDLLYQMPGKILGNLYIIPADSYDSDAQIRKDTADLIASLNEDPDHRPAVIGVDIPLYGEADKKIDQSLAQVVGDADNVVLASQIHFDSKVLMSGGKLLIKDKTISSVQHPIPPIDESVDHGFTNLMLDRDGKVRHGIWEESYGDELCHQFGRAVYEKYCDQTGQKTANPPLSRNKWYVNFRGKTGTFDAGISWEELISYELPEELDGAIVLLTLPRDTVEIYRTPLGKQTSTEVYANMIQAMVREDFKREIPAIIQIAMMFGLLIVFRLAFLNGIVTAIIALGGGIGLYPALCAATYHLLGFVLDPFYLPLFTLTLFLYHLAEDWLIEMRERLKVRKTLRRYLSPETANRLLLNHVSLEKPEKREIAVLFVDIRGFTPLSESLAPSQMADVLREYLTLTSSAIFNNGGTLDKFIGDATMGFFNAPLEQEDYVYHAVKAAMEIAAGGARIRDTFYKKYGRNIYFGIGVHFGSAVVGEIGSEYRKDYTAIGDTVNTASRLESNAKPGEVLVSLKVCEELQGRLTASFVGERQIKGKSKPMMLYRVESLDGVAPPATEEENEKRRQNRNGRPSMPQRPSASDAPFIPDPMYKPENLDQGPSSLPPNPLV